MNRRELMAGAGAVAAASMLPAEPAVSMGITRYYIDTFRIGDVRQVVYEDPLTLRRYRVPMRVVGRRRWRDRWQFSLKSCGPSVEVPEHTALWVLA